MASYAEDLELARTAYRRRLQGDAYDEYNEADRRWKGASIDVIRKEIEWLERKAQQESRGGGGTLLRPIDV